MISGREQFSSQKWSTKSKDTDAFLRKEASWRRMFVAQPPPALLKVVNLAHMRGGTLKSEGLVSFDTAQGAGLRMAELYDLTEEHIFTHLVCGFRVLWNLPAVVQCRSSINDQPDSAISENPQTWITLVRSMTVQCSRQGYEGKKSFRSQGFRSLDVNYHETVDEPY